MSGRDKGTIILKCPTGLFNYLLCLLTRINLLIGQKLLVVPPPRRHRDLGEGLLVEIVEDPAPPYEGHEVVEDREESLEV